MTLAKVNQNEFPSFSNLFDDFFNTELSDWKRTNYSSTNTTLPKVNIRESDEGFEIEMAAPGMDKKEFNVKLDQDMLTISSQKEMSSKDSNYTRREFAYHSFTRTFKLPESADGDKINASYKNGILSLSIPKKEEAKPKPPKAISIS